MTQRIKKHDLVLPLPFTGGLRVSAWQSLTSFRNLLRASWDKAGSWGDFWLRMGFRCSCEQAQAEQSVIRVTVKKLTAALVFLAAICSAGPGRQAKGQLLSQYPPKTARMRLRLVGVAYADHPRSSFFSSQEVFVAETEIGREEWSLIKLVFTFLPYQERLSESGFDYSVVHEVSAWRDLDCDQTIEQLTARELPKRHEPLIYARNVPRPDLEIRKVSPLACYSAATNTAAGSCI